MTSGAHLRRRSAKLVKQHDRDLPADAYRICFDRVAVAWEYVNAHSYGVRLDHVHQAVCETCGPCNQRTTRRALVLLERLGLVDYFQPDSKASGPSLYFPATVRWELDTEAATVRELESHSRQGIDPAVYPPHRQHVAKLPGFA